MEKRAARNKLISILFNITMNMMKRNRPDSLDKEERVEDKAEPKEPVKLSMFKCTNFSHKDIKYENKLDRQYFRQEVVELAKSLLGKVMVRKINGSLIKAVIVET